MTTEVKVILYLVGIPLSIIVMASINKRILSYADRAPTGLVILFSLVWPAGLVLFSIMSLTMSIDDYPSKVRKFLDKFIRGE